MGYRVWGVTPNDYALIPCYNRLQASTTRAAQETVGGEQVRDLNPQGREQHDVEKTDRENNREQSEHERGNSSIFDGA